MRESRAGGYRCGRLGGLPASMAKSRQQQLQVLAAEAADDAVVGGDDRVGQVLFALLELQDFFLHRVLGDQPVGKDAARLADAVGAVDGLRLDGRVPPRIEQVDVL